METAAVIIAAAGASRRMQSKDKLWTPLAGRIILARTVDVFQQSPLIETIVIVTSRERLEDTKALSQQEGWHKVVTVVTGGARRQDSVGSGLDALAEIQPFAIQGFSFDHSALSAEFIGKLSEQKGQVN